MNKPLCPNCWANNNGGLWCWKHKDVKKEDCEQCKEKKKKG